MGDQRTECEDSGEGVRDGEIEREGREGDKDGWRREKEMRVVKPIKNRRSNKGGIENAKAEGEWRE